MNRYTFAIRKYWPFLIGLNALVCAGAIANIAATEKTWTANAELIIPNETSKLNADLGEIGTLNNGSLTYSQQLSPLKIVASILDSETVMETVRTADPEKDNFDRIQSYQQLFKIAPKSETTIIELSVDASSPELAEARLDSLISTFQNRLTSLREDETKRRSAFAVRDLESATQALEAARSNLSNFQSNANIVDGDVQTAGIVGTLGDLTNSQAQSIAQAQAERALADNLSQQLNLSSDQALSLLKLNENQSYQFVQTTLSEVEAMLVDKRALFTDEHPEVQYLLQQRNELNEQIDQYIQQLPNVESFLAVDIAVGQGTADLIQQLVIAETQAISYEQQAQQLQNTINQLNSDLLTLPGKQATLEGLQQDYESAEATYRGLTAQLQEAKLSAFGAYPIVQVLDEPSADLKPSGPNKKLAAVGAMIACISGTAALTMLLVSRDSLLSGEELLNSEMEILGQVPRLKTTSILDGLDKAQPIFQKIASAVSILPIQNKRLLITSPGPGEGKTTVSIGLASALTTLGHKVLLVDGSFQRNGLMAAENGLTGYCENSESLDNFPEISANIVNISDDLDLLSIGFETESAIERLVSRGDFERILTQTQEQGEYDYVIIDGANIDQSSTSTLLAKTTSNVLMVTRPGMSKSVPFRESMDYLAWYGAKVLGLVVNAGEAPTPRPIEYTYNSHNYGVAETRVLSHASATAVTNGAEN